MPEYRCVNAARVVHSAFVSVSDDHKKIEAGRTWDGLAALHRDLTAPIPSPQVRFPSDVKLSDLNPLSDALVGTKRWDAWTVLQCRDKILSNNPSETLQEFQDTAGAAVISLFQHVKEAERVLFGNNSYFRHLERDDDAS